jgi:transcriptional regulator with XRE-family HTH domain
MVIRPTTRLQALQRASGQSQSELARRMGVSQTTVHRVLVGEYSVARYARALAQGLGCRELLVWEAAGEAPPRKVD